MCSQILSGGVAATPPRAGAAAQLQPAELQGTAGEAAAADLARDAVRRSQDTPSVAVPPDGPPRASAAAPQQSVPGLPQLAAALSALSVPASQQSQRSPTQLTADATQASASDREVVAALLRAASAAPVASMAQQQLPQGADGGSQTNVLGMLQNLLSRAQSEASSLPADRTPMGSPASLLQQSAALARAASDMPAVTQHHPGTPSSAQRSLSKQVSFQDWRGLAQGGAHSGVSTAEEPHQHAASGLPVTPPRRRAALPAEHPKVSPRLFVAPREQLQQHATSGPVCLPGPATPIRGSRARRASSPCHTPQREASGASPAAAWVPPGSRCSKFAPIGSNQARTRPLTGTGTAALSSPRSPRGAEAGSSAALSARAGGGTPDDRQPPQLESPAQSRSSSPPVVGCNGRVWPVSGTSRAPSSKRSTQRFVAKQPRQRAAAPARARSLQPVNSAQAAAVARLRLDAQEARQWGDATQRPVWDSRRSPPQATRSLGASASATPTARCSQQPWARPEQERAWAAQSDESELARHFSTLQALQAVAAVDSDDEDCLRADDVAASGRHEARLHALEGLAEACEPRSAELAAPRLRGARHANRGWNCAEADTDPQVAILGGTGRVVAAGASGADNSSGYSALSKGDNTRRERKIDEQASAAPAAQRKRSQAHEPAAREASTDAPFDSECSPGVVAQRTACGRGAQDVDVGAHVGSAVWARASHGGDIACLDPLQAYTNDAPGGAADGSCVMVTTGCGSLDVWDEQAAGLWVRILRPTLVRSATRDHVRSPAVCLDWRAKEVLRSRRLECLCGCCP